MRTPLTLITLILIIITTIFTTSNTSFASLQTKYPIILVHGFMGLDSVYGIKNLNYFYSVADTLNSLGANVYQVKINSSASSVERGKNLIKHIERILIQEKTDKVHLIGHSQGGLTSRYVLKHAPHLLASITTVGSPHMGSAIADFVLSKRVTKTAFQKKLLYNLLDILGMAVEKISNSNYAQNSAAALYELSTAGAAKFNADYPAGLPLQFCNLEGIQTVYKGVHLYSWISVLPDKVNSFDTLDVIFQLSKKIFVYMNNPDMEENDGIVGKCSMYFGQVINPDSPYQLNHAEEINLSIRSLLKTKPAEGRSDPIALYIEHVGRLQDIE